MVGKHRAQVLADLISAHGLNRGAEIGVGSGPTSNALLELFRNLQWIAVDHWPEGYPLHPPSRGLRTAEDQIRIRRSYMSVLSRFSPRLCLIEKPSVEAARDVDDGSLDIVFIDGDHSYEGCRDDILAWLPKLRKGGWLTGHDYYPAFPGVMRAVDELIDKPILGDDFVWMVQV